MDIQSVVDALGQVRFLLGAFLGAFVLGELLLLIERRVLLVVALAVLIPCSGFAVSPRFPGEMACGQSTVMVDTLTLTWDAGANGYLYGTSGLAAFFDTGGACTGYGGTETLHISASWWGDCYFCFVDGAWVTFDDACRTHIFDLGPCGAYPPSSPTPSPSPSVTPSPSPSGSCPCDFTATVAAVGQLRFMVAL